ncbi:hypothetical protein F5146DRAFT_1006571 [Armillaria mellea]|nr:hypothetical protein F5146DRAFT_1006571 [Armillaria mellea]
MWMGADLVRVKEDNMSVLSQGYDAYHHTKALGEKIILNMNNVNGMKVVILRPCGMMGERDKQLMWHVAKLYEDGQHNVQIGDNTNLVDYLYARNAAQAHWSFNQLIFKELGDDGSKKIVIIPQSLALFLPMVTQLVCKIMGKKSEFNLFNVWFVTAIQWYNINKAHLLLSYEPNISLEKGIHQTVKMLTMEIVVESI